MPKHPTIREFEQVNTVFIFHTFRTSSSKHCCTLTRVLALHSIKRHPYSLAKFMPSFFVTTLSLSCKEKWFSYAAKPRWHTTIYTSMPRVESDNKCKPDYTNSYSTQVHIITCQNESKRVNKWEVSSAQRD